jgi:hypothetical protein
MINTKALSIQIASMLIVILVLMMLMRFIMVIMVFVMMMVMNWRLYSTIYLITLYLKQ